jgi:F5/8 type C domain
MKQAAFLSGLAAMAVMMTLSACVSNREPAAITMKATAAPASAPASPAKAEMSDGMSMTNAAATNAAASTAPVASTNGIKLTAVRADSEETASEDGHATNAVDGNPATMWHTQWTDEAPPCPHEIIIEMTPPSTIKGFTYLPRQDEEVNGTIKEYEFYISDDDKDFGQPVKKGTMPDEGKGKATVTFEPKKGRYIKLRAMSEINGGAWASAAEIGVIPN